MKPEQFNHFFTDWMLTPGRQNIEMFGRIARLSFGSLASCIRSFRVHPVLGQYLQLSSLISADPMSPLPSFSSGAQDMLLEFSRI